MTAAARTMAAARRSWRALPARQRQLFALLFVMVGALLLHAAIVRPLGRQLARLHERIREAEQRLADATIASNQAEEVAQAHAAYAPYLQAPASPEGELAAVLTEVESAVREAGMVLINLKPDDGAGAGALAVRVEAEASTLQLVQLLDRLQRSTRLLNVTGLTVRAAEGRTLRTTLVIVRPLPPASG